MRFIFADKSKYFPKERLQGGGCCWGLGEVVCKDKLVCCLFGEETVEMHKKGNKENKCEL